MRQFTRMFLAVAALLLCVSAQAAATLLKDINQSAIPGAGTVSSFISVNRLTLFAAADLVNGQELWRTDGTAAGTQIVRDVAPGANSSGITRLTTLNGTAYFYANDGVNGEELWRSDGSSAGTYVVADINPGAADSLPRGVDGPIDSLGGVLIFAADDAKGTGLWRSDGTASGTVRLSDAKLGSPLLTVAAERVFFEGPGSGGGGGELWTSDGTPGGTKQLTNLFPGVPTATLGSMTPTSTGLFFIANGGVNGSGVHTIKLCFINFDGSALQVVKDFTDSNSPLDPSQFFSMVSLGTDVVFNVSGHGIYHADRNSADLIYAQYSAYEFQVLGNRAIFTKTAAGSAWGELWTTDGTAAGTHRLGTSVQLESVQAIDAINRFAVGEDGAAYFSGLLATGAPYVYGVWRTDGTDAGTAIYSALPTGVSLGYGLVRFAGKVYYECGCGAMGKGQLWQSDGTSAGTGVFFDPGSDVTAENLSVAGASLFFTANVGQKLMISDGTSAGTRPLVMFSTESQGSDSNASEFTQLGDKVIFVADDGAHGYELFASGGTSQSTHLIVDLNPGAGNGAGNQPVVLGNRALFTGNDGVHGEQLWITDGSATGTAVLAPAIPALDPWNVVVLGGVAYFAADDGVHGAQPWRSDGTVAGTYMIANIGSAPFPSNFRLWNGKVLFYSSTMSQWWITDGTAAGTRAIAPAVTAGALGATLNGLFYFGGLTNGGSNGDLWVTDGTAAGTHIAVSLAGEAITSIHGLSNRIILETAGTNPGQNFRSALYATDGSSADTVLISLDAVLASIALDNQLVYEVSSSDGSTALVRSTDGTVNGTHDIVRVPNAGTAMYAYKGTAIFTSSQFGPGTQRTPSVWRTDGTAAGTHLVASGIRASYFRTIGDSLYFLGWTEQSGAEPFFIDEGSPNTAGDQAGTPAETAVTVDVLANDGFLSAALRPETVSIREAAHYGSVAIDPANGKITYTPAKGFSGTDTFSYAVADSLGQQSSPTSVTVVVGAEVGAPPGSASSSDPGGDGSGTGTGAGTGTGGGTSDPGTPASGPSGSKGGGGALSLSEILILAVVLLYACGRRLRADGAI